MTYIYMLLIRAVEALRGLWQTPTARDNTELLLTRLQWFPCQVEGGQFLIKLGFYGPGTFALVGTPGANYDPTKPVVISSPVKDYLVPWGLFDDDELAAMAEAVCEHEEKRR